MFRKLKIIIAVVGSILVFFSTLLGYGSIESFALDIANETSVILSSYEVSEDIIVPGEEFSLKLVLNNPSERAMARSVLVNVTTDQGVTSVYPSVTQVYVGDMGPGDSKEVDFSFVANNAYPYTSASFYVSIETSSRSNYVVVSAPVEINTDLFSIVSTSVPEEAVSGMPIASSISFRSLSNDSLSNVAMNVYVDDTKVVMGIIGNLFAGASKTQNASFFINEPGKHTVNYEMECTDADGSVHVVGVYSGTITVIEANDVDFSAVQDQVVQKVYSKRDKLIMVGGLGGCVFLVAGIVLIIKKYN